MTATATAGSRRPGLTATPPSQATARPGRAPARPPGTGDSFQPATDAPGRLMVTAGAPAGVYGGF